ncbi:MAG: hypothetical protein JWO97_984 [Acidobacteria bacterium]|nr:hypothetical protein [Acidobacteriota bacterium]
MRSVVSAVAVSSLLLLTGVADNDVVPPGATFPRVNRGIGRLLIANDVGESWSQFNALEGGTRSVLSSANVARLNVFWRATLPEIADGAPVYISNVELAGGVKRDLVIVTTKVGRLVATDARTGLNVWQTTPPEGPRWTTSSPAVDPNHLFVYSYGLDGYIHKYAADDGSEITGNGWPELVTLKGSVEKGSSPITIATARNGSSYLYMVVAAYPEPGDDGDYQGHLVTVNLATGEQKIFNAGCSDKLFHFVENGNESNDCGHTQGGIWGRAGAVYDPITDRVFVTTGNGVYDGDQGGYNWGSSVVALKPDGSLDGGTPLDTYTPTDYERLNVLDLDLSSASVSLLPTTGNRDLPRLGVQAGKDSMLRLLNLSNLSGRNGPRHLGGELDLVQVPQGGHLVMHPATWFDSATHTAWIFASNFHGIAAYTLDVSGSLPELVLQWWRPEAATSPVVVNNVLYYAGSLGMQGLEPTTGRVLWHDTGIANVHWQSPIVVNGMIYIADEAGNLTAYSTVPPRR